jgi:hypothetical protein
MHAGELQDGAAQQQRVLYKRSEWIGSWNLRSVIVEPAAGGQPARLHWYGGVRAGSLMLGAGTTAALKEEGIATSLVVLSPEGEAHFRAAPEGASLAAWQAEIAAAVSGTPLDADADADAPSAAPLELPADPTELLGRRAFVRDIAVLAEQLVMHDMREGYWEHAARGSPHTTPGWLCSRESAMMPDRVGDTPERAPADVERCEVRRRRAAWAHELSGRYGVRLVAWIEPPDDSDPQKQAAVLRLHTSPPLLVVVFRGSKKRLDYMVTDPDIRFTQVPMVATEGPAAASTAPKPKVTRGLVRAYAGARVRAALNEALTATPGAMVLVTGPPRRARARALRLARSP